MESTSAGAHVQARFVTEQKQYAVPDSPFSIPASVTVIELSDLINKLLNQVVEGEDEGERRARAPVDFDFLVNGEFLRTALGAHMLERALSTEEVVEVEYLVRQAAPQPAGSITHDDWISSLQGCRDCILSGSYDNGVTVWKTSGKSLLTLRYHTEPVKCVAWITREPGKSLIVSGSHDQTLAVCEWDEDANAASCLYVCRGHSRSVDTVAVDPSRTKFCSGSFDSQLKVWSASPDQAGEGAPTGEEEEEEGGHPAKKSRLLPGTHGPPLTRTPLMTFDSHKEAVTSVLWPDPGQVCSASWDHTIRLWDLQQGVLAATLSATKALLALAHSPHTHLLASGSVDRHVRLWDPRAGQGAVTRASLSNHSGWVSAMAWSPSHPHQLISGSYDKSLKLWDIRSPQAPLYNMTGVKDKILAADWSIPELMLCGGADNSIHAFKTTPTQAPPTDTAPGQSH